MLALFHLSVVALNVYSIWYDQIYVDLPFPQKEFEEMPFKARLCFVTFWCLILQTIYFTMAFLNDITGANAASSKNPPAIKKVKDATFSLAFPCALFVAGAFWGIYALDKDMIFPENISKKVPIWLNHVMHTTIVPFIVLEMLFSRIEYPSRKFGLKIASLFTLAYHVWINLIYFVKGHYVYPFLVVASWIVRILIFFLIIPAMVIILYLLCEYLNSLVNRRESDISYSNGYSKGYNKVTESYSKDYIKYE